MSNYQIPWDVNGPLSHVYRWMDQDRIEWRDNITFEATLTIESFYWRQASAVYLKDEADTTYKMFIADFEKMVLAGRKIENARVRAEWTFIKRGTAYGIRDVTAPK